MNNIELGSVLTPAMADQRGITLERERQHHSIRLCLYRESSRDRDIYYVSVSHIVLTITSLQRVAQYAFLHG